MADWIISTIFAANKIIRYTMKLIKGEFKEKLELQFAPSIKAGFPSPAEDYLSESLDFNRDLIKYPEVTFYATVDGDSMTGFGINPGDIAVIDKSTMGKISKILWMLVLMMVLGLASCTNEDTPVNPQEYDGVPLVILDTDIGSSTDDLFSLEMLYNYQEQGKCKLLGVVVDRVGEDCAACADVMNTYFNNGNLPIGLVRNGIKDPKVWINYKALPTYKKDDDKLMFARSIDDYSALPDGWQLYRRLLAAQPDHSVSICSIGFTTCLAQLLESVGDAYSPLSGVELVRRKVKCLYIQGGSFGLSAEPDYNFLQGIGFAKTFFRLWPSDVDIIFDSMETGNGIEYLPEQVVSDVSWTDYHPIKQVYMTCNCNTGQMMWDPLTVINAVEGDDLFMLSDRGTVELNDDGMVIFTFSATGNSRVQMPVDDAWRAAMLEMIRNVNKIH